MKKEFWLVIILAIIIVILLGALAWPKANNADVKSLNIKANQEITSPLVVEGQARGTWFFEASFPIKITDEQGNVLGTSFVQAQSDWMTEDFVPFKGEISFISPKDQRGFLVLAKDNPSGLPENNKEIKIPVLLAKTETLPEITRIKLYFGNLALSSSSEQDECKRVYAVEREILKTEAVARATIEELLKGPTQSEKDAGFFTSIPANSKLNSISIVNGEARVDFDATTESGGGSCSMASRVAEITQTLLQFPTITSVKLSINGRTGDIFQP